MFTAITNLIQSKTSGSTVKQQFQDLVKHIRRKSRSESLDQDDSSYNNHYSPGSSPNLYSILETTHKESSSTKTLDDTVYNQMKVLDEIHRSLSRRTRHHNIGDDMNENWLFENSSVTLEASNCRICGEYMMTSNYDFYVDILPPKCMCKCEH